MTSVKSEKDCMSKFYTKLNYTYTSIIKHFSLDACPQSERYTQQSFCVARVVIFVNNLTNLTFHLDKI